jgi:hypothetical protein
VGRAAGDFLVGMLARGEFGIPEVPRRILLDGIWQIGKTARNLAGNKAKSKHASPVAALEVA